jgi:hypothetical protein
MPWLAAGCVVPEPEKFREPERSPPILDLNGVAPPINQLVQVSTTGVQQFSFTIPVRSEDSGERLSGAMYVNYKARSEFNVGYIVLEPSTLEDASREFRFTPDLQSIPCPPKADERDPGCCANLTLVVTHESNISTEGGRIQPDPALSRGDLALATWWLAVNAPATAPSHIKDCPLPGGNP